MYKIVSISEINSGKEGEVTKIDGGHGVMRRLDALGVREGKIIKKISSNTVRGPVIFEIEKTQIAVGRGIAKKIFIKIKE